MTLPIQVGLSRIVTGTMGHLLSQYYQSAGFLALQPQTRTNYRHILERWRSEKLPSKDLTYGDIEVKQFRRAHLVKILDMKAATPGAARNLLNRLRVVFKYAIDLEMIEANPCLNIARPKSRSREGFIPWSQSEIDQFKDFWDAGSKPRLALTLLLSTAVRRSDAVTLGRQHIKASDQGPELYFWSKKGKEYLTVPIDHDLQVELDRLPKSQMMFLQTEYGKPFSEAGFTKWFVERAVMAGLKNRTPHGLRKAAARDFAESGSSPHEMSAVDGHKTLAEAERYTRSANRRKLAWNAVNKREAAKK
ncbi:MAG: site-specific integrase [Asticcacaulis sp.]